MNKTKIMIALMHPIYSLNKGQKGKVVSKKEFRGII